MTPSPPTTNSRIHLDVFDYPGAEALAEEACDMARSLNFLPPIVSTGLDLLLTFARRQEVGRAEKLVDKVAEAAERTGGWHGWRFKGIRLVEARAEIALARGAWEEAVRWASGAIQESHARGSIKYQVLGLWARAQALAALGRTHQAIADLRQAVALARGIGEPALLLRTAGLLLTLEGDDALAPEARQAAQRIAAALPDPDMRRRFEAAEPVRLLFR